MLRIERSFLNGPAIWLVYFFCFVCNLSVSYGVNNFLQPTARNAMYHSASILGLVLLGLMTLCQVRWTPETGQVAKRESSLGAAAWPSADLSWLFIGGIVSFSIFMTTPTRLAVMVLLVYWTTMLGARLRLGNARFPCVIAVLGGLIAMAHSTSVYALMAPDQGQDILPISKAAIHHFLAGRDPYWQDYKAISGGPFFYLPAQWLFYLPFEASGVSLHWVNFVCVIVAVAAFEGLLFDRGSATQYRTAFYVTLLSLPAIHGLDTTVPPMWTLMVLLATALMRRRYGLAGILLGVLLATSQVMLAIAVLLGAFGLRGPDRRGALIRGGALALVTVLLLLGPWIIWSPDFLRTMFIDRPATVVVAWRVWDGFARSMSIGNLLEMAGLLDLRAFLQVAVLLTGTIWLLLQPRLSASRFLMHAGIVFLAAISCNGQIWRYYYIAPLVMIACGFAALSDGNEIAAATDRVNRHWDPTNDRRSVS